jgi:thioredoxin 1
MAQELTSSNFKSEILESALPAIVDFWATWCMPCRMIAPVVDEISAEYKDKIKVGKVNIDDESEIAGQFGIMSIPTLLFFKGGKVVETIVGAVPKEHILEKMKGAFGNL